MGRVPTSDQRVVDQLLGSAPHMREGDKRAASIGHGRAGVPARLTAPGLIRSELGPASVGDDALAQHRPVVRDPVLHRIQTTARTLGLLR